uniref:Uncharacterized protein n=1 Tax=Molossus molossus TaxID=27622 RepID=A0A7J8JVL5_MOLMO|nr:hypothetical protein HJG59_007934 [Molossus molossus]
MEPPWRPLGRQCVPRDPRFSAPGRRPRSSCLLRTRPCKCAHLILNPLRRSPCERERGGLDNPLQIGGLGTLVLGKMSAPRMQIGRITWRNRQSFCLVVGEQNQTTACRKHSCRPFNAEWGPQKFSGCFHWKRLPIKCSEKPAELGKVISHPGIYTVFPISFLSWPLWSVV